MTNEGPFSKDYRFRDQIRSAAISIASNIAEGDELNTNKQSIYYFHIAKGSTAEVMTQLIIAKEVNYISEQQEKELIDRCDHIARMLHRLINSRK